MQTIEEAKAYYSSMPTWKDENSSYGITAEEGPAQDELEAFKRTIDLGLHTGVLQDTNVEAVLAKHGSLVDWATWTVAFDGVGLVHLHLYDLSGPGDAHTWAELWLEGEPHWDGVEPYECTWEQIAAVIQSLPDADRERYLEFAFQNDELRKDLSARGVGASTLTP